MEERQLEAGTQPVEAELGESYQSIAHRMQDFALEKVAEYPGKQIVVVSHESPIWSYRHMLETGHPEHNMLLRHTALASITSITYDCNTGENNVHYVRRSGGGRRIM